MALNQNTRTLSVSAIGASKFVLVAFSGHEELSGLFSFWLDLLSEGDAIIPAEEIVGQNVSFATIDEDEEPRYFNGFVRRFVIGEPDHSGHRRYRCEVVPWLWFLTQNSNCKIFQDKTAVEIIEQVFTDLGFGSDLFTSKDVRTARPKREYCVQYRETDFNFVSRLMEEEGIAYFFKHGNGKHVLVMFDNAEAHLPGKNEVVDCLRNRSASRDIGPHIRNWEHSYQFRTGRWSHADYNFKAPKTRLLSPEKTLLKVPDAVKFEYFDYPGNFAEKSIGAPLARMRMEELEADYNLVQGTSTYRSFSPGIKFTIGKHPTVAEQKKSYVVRRISHTAHANDYTTGQAATGTDYENQFECFPATTPFRPSRTTLKPIVTGCQTAVVTGPPGEEIHPDEFGRVKVQFHWDRVGQFDDKSSCWIRVSQVHAGQGWGYMDIPRIGEEVIVDFLEGDPDRPIVVGRVYNGQNKPPYELPANKTARGNKTKTYKGAGFNEMSMDDTPGKEKINIHAQYDMATTVKHDHSVKIETGNHTFDVDTGTSTTTVKGAVTEVYKSTHSTTVHATQSTTVQETIDIMTNKSFIHVSSPTEIVLSVKASKITITPDTIKLESDNIILRGKALIDGGAPDIKLVGDTQVKISSPSVQVSGKNEAIIGVGSQSVKCDPSQVAVAGANIKSAATGQHDISGAIVKIN